MSLDLIQGTSGEESSSRWDGLQVAFKPICSVPYRNIPVYIYESLDDGETEARANRVHYFYTPLLLLEPTTAEYDYVAAEKRHAVSFDITFWTDEMESALLDYMTQERLEIDEERPRIRPVPFEKVMLTRRAHSNDSCKFPDEWEPYDSHTSKTFRLICASKEEAESIVKKMLTRPEQFKSTFEIKLKFVRTETRCQRKVISLENAFNSELFSKIDQLFPGASEVLLTAEDTEKLLSEATSNAMKIHSDSKDGAMTSEDEKAVYNGIKSMLVSGERLIDAQSEGLWSSVFWSDDTCRPDEIARELNEVHKKLDELTQNELIDAFTQRSTETAFEEIVSSIRALSDPDCDKGNARDAWSNFLQNTLKTEQLNSDTKVKGFEEIMSKIEWQGEKFAPKPLTLTRIALNKMRSKQNLTDIEVSVPRSSIVLTVPVNVDLKGKTSYHGFDDARKMKLAKDSSGYESSMASDEKEMVRITSDLETSFGCLAMKMAELESVVDKSSADSSENNQLLRKAMDGLKGDLILLIDDAKAKALARESEIEREMERLKRDLLEKEDSLNKRISEAKQSMMQEISEIKAASGKRQGAQETLIGSVMSQLKSGLSSDSIVSVLTSALAVLILSVGIAMYINIRADESKIETTIDLGSRRGYYTVDLGPFAYQKNELDTGEWMSRFEAETEKRISDLESHFTSSLAKNEKVFFSARPSSQRYTDGRIDFREKGLINVGWTIDLDNGTFTVPRDGHYALFFTSLSADDTPDTAVYIVRNSEQLAATSMEGEQPFTLSVVQMLKRGDQLSVVIDHGGIWLSMAKRKERKYDRPLKPISVFSAFSID